MMDTKITISKPNFKTMATVATHGGVFHADDVFATALIKIINPEIEVLRLFKAPEDGTFCYDFGGGEFDHHKPENLRSREDGTPYSSFGLLWEAVGRDLVDENSWAIIDASLVKPIDEQDNGVSQNPLSIAVSDMNPAWDEDTTPDDAFVNAVAFATQTINAYLKKANSVQRAKLEVQGYLDKAENGLVIMDRYAPFQAVLCEASLEQARLVAFPSLRGGFALNTIPVTMGSHESRLQLPEEWIESKPEGCTFCHVKRFIAQFDTMEHLVKAATSILVSEGKE